MNTILFNGIEVEMQSIDLSMNVCIENGDVDIPHVAHDDLFMAMAYALFSCNNKNKETTGVGEWKIDDESVDMGSEGYLDYLAKITAKVYGVGSSYFNEPCDGEETQDLKDGVDFEVVEEKQPILLPEKAGG